MTLSILVVDDDLEVLDLLKRVFEREHYLVDTATNGEEMDRHLLAGRYDVVLLDVMLPGRDGLQLCKDVREKNPEVAILMISAKGDDVDRIVGLEIGADDYLPKPFNSRELLARIKAVMRRKGSSSEHKEPQDNQTFIAFGDYTIRTGEMIVVRTKNGEPIELTSGEYSLLLALAQRMGRPVDRDTLLNITQGRDAMPYDRSIDVMIGRLRQKLEKKPGKPELIKTVRNQGYVLFSGQAKGA
ncbi:MAG: response regulator [Alphaproteobacteria bacterium]|nr:response regulator [Alphaproteobacteria bacterium]MCB1839628.1 response regulator [Alphaproteobacteria bacterium]